MEKNIIQNGIQYELKGEQYIPMLELPEQPNYAIGKYGRMHLDYLKQHRRGTYGSLKAQAKLNQHLHEIDVQASELLNSIISDFAKKNGINEEIESKRSTSLGSGNECHKSVCRGDRFAEPHIPINRNIPLRRNLR